LTLDDLAAQYCNKNCIGYSAFSIAKRFIVKKIGETCVRYFRWLFTTVAIYIAWQADHVRRLLY